MKRENWGVLISGNGSNLQAILDSRDVNVSLVVASSNKAYGVLRARRMGIPVEIPPEPKISEKWILETLKKYSVKNVFLAGYMKILSPSFIDEIERRGGKLVNIHPSLLPKHKGLNAYEAAIAAGDERLGVTVHYVNAEVDSGKVLLKRSFSPAGSKLYLHINEHLALNQSLKGLQ